MTTAFIKNSLIERVKKMKGSEAKKFYGLMLEDDIDESMYKTFEQIPVEHKAALNKGLIDLKEGRKQDANLFINNIKRKHAL